ncbi:hypothetical protein F2P81_020543 [Scophthalmus maximus]|uniref:Uncharacterized protein n=1 Tax=Scophthalmus maximus TaxID=52904 RepID=A0A6A4SAJ0_SCOMX|nr:hypothetical protein F2P81_020543 [Scophthalmus maximus]
MSTKTARHFEMLIRLFRFKRFTFSPLAEQRAVDRLLGASLLFSFDVSLSKREQRIRPFAAAAAVDVFFTSVANHPERRGALRRLPFVCIERSRNAINEALHFDGGTSRGEDMTF